MIEPTSPVPAPVDPPPGPSRPPTVGERIGAVAVACWGGVLVALLGAFLTPYRWGAVLVPVSLLVVAAGLVAVTQFTYRVTEHAGLSLIPGVLWLIVSLVLSGRTTEGDLVLTQQNWVANVYLLVGSVTLGVLGYRMVLRR
jgi:hypothetical protein